MPSQPNKDKWCDVTFHQCFYWVCLAIVFFFADRSHGAEAAPATPLNALEAIRANIAKISSIDIRAQYTVAHKSAKGDVVVQAVVKVHMREQGDRFWYEAEEDDGKKWLPDACIIAYDGTNFQKLFKDTNLLSVKKGNDRRASPDAVFFDPITILFPYYPIQRRKSMGYMTTLSDITDQQKWESSIKDIVSSPNPVTWGVGQSQKTLLTFSCPGRTATAQAVETRFGLDPAQGLSTLSWEQWAGAKVVTKSEVSELSVENAQGFTFYFPKKAELVIFQPSGGETHVSYELEALDLGQRYADSDFTIDPSLASMIYDADTKSTIKVPR